MEIYFNTPREITKTINDTISLEQFKALLQRSMPKEIYNSHYSNQKPCYHIVEYIDDEVLIWYADAWADKTPKKATFDELYQSIRYEGLAECYFKKDDVNLTNG